MSSLIARSLSYAKVSRQHTHAVRSFFQGIDLGNRNKEALDKVCHSLLKARADPFHGHRKERLPDSEQKKVLMKLTYFLTYLLTCLLSFFLSYLLTYLLTYIVILYI